MSHARKISSRRRARETGASSEVDLQAKQELKERVEKYFLEFDADKTDRLEAAEVREILKRENERDVARRRAAAQTAASDVATTALLESAEEGGGNGGGGHGGSGAPTEPPPCANGPTAVTAVTATTAAAIVEDGLATDLALDGTVRHVPPDGITRGALVDELVKLKAYLAQQMFIDKMLREFDTDQSGYLTANELPGLLKKVMGNSSAGGEVTDEDVKFIVQQCDGSGTRATGSGAIDGQIDRAELLVAIATWKRALRDDKPRTSRRSSVCTVS